VSGLGRRGEEAAARYLRRHGYRVVERNLRLAGAEVDLVVEKDDLVCFVEVKSRGRSDRGDPLEFVDRNKQQRLIRAARLFCARRRWQGHGVRFDAVSVLETGSGLEINHLPDAFVEE